MLERADTVLVDSQTRSIFGPLTAGRVVDLDGHRMTIGGQYVLGHRLSRPRRRSRAATLIFSGIFPQRPRETVNLGLVR